MVCHSNEPDRKWSCTWCQLRVCRACSDDLAHVRGRDLAALLSARAKVASPAVHISVEDADGSAEEYEADEDAEAEAEYARDRLARMSSIAEETAEERGRTVERRPRRDS
jgi:hypothetical protein